MSGEKFIGNNIRFFWLSLSFSSSLNNSRYGLPRVSYSLLSQLNLVTEVGPCNMQMQYFLTSLYPEQHLCHDNFVLSIKLKKKKKNAGVFTTNSLNLGILERKIKKRCFKLA